MTGQNLTPIMCRFDAEQLAELDAAAEAEGRNRSQQIRWIVRQWLETRTDAPDPSA